MNEMNIIERAFELAPQCGSVSEVRQILVREGYFNVEAHLTGRQIQQDIRSRLNPERREEEKSRTQRVR